MKGHQEYKNVSVVNATLKPEEMKIMKEIGKKMYYRIEDVFWGEYCC